MKNFKDLLKDAILKNDLQFLVNNRSNYLINEVFDDEDGDSLLMYALSYKDSSDELIRFIVDEGADQSITNKVGENILHSVVYSGRIDRLQAFASPY